MKTAVITGATGYIGSSLTRQLVALNYNVKIIVRPSSSLRRLQDVIEKVQIYFYNDNYESLVKIFQESKIDVVFHLAAQSGYDCKPDDISSLLDSNIKFGTFLLEAMVNQGCFNLVNTGTYWQHADSSICQPICLYAATKKAFEDILEYYVFCKGLSAITLLLFDVYGPADDRKKLFTMLHEAYVSGKEVNMTEGKQQVSMVHVNDVIQAYICASELINKDDHCNNHNKYYIGNSLISLRELVDLYISITGRYINVRWGGVPYRATQIMKPYIGEALPNFKARINLELGIKTLFENED